MQLQLCTKEGKRSPSPCGEMSVTRAEYVGMKGNRFALLAVAERRYLLIQCRFAAMILAVDDEVSIIPVA